MLRATIMVNSLECLWDCFNWLKSWYYCLAILSVNFELKTSKCITVTFNFANTFIAEVKIRFGEMA